MLVKKQMFFYLCISLITSSIKIEAQSTKLIKKIHDTYTFVHPFHDGLAAVEKGDKWNFVDTSGNLITNTWFQMVTDFSNGNAHVMIYKTGWVDESNLRWGIINTSGKYVITPIYLRLIGDYSEGMIAAQHEDYSWSYIDQDEKNIIQLGKNCLEALPFQNGKALVKYRNGNTEIIDVSGKRLARIRFDDIENFKDGLAKVSKNNKYGFIDQNGEIIIPIKFETAYSFEEGTASVGIGSNGKLFAKSKFGIIDKTGKFIIPPIYGSTSSFKNGLAKVGKLSDNGEYSSPIIIDISGKELTKPIYDYISEFKDGFAITRVQYRGDGLIDSTGKEILPAEYEEINPFTDGYARVKYKRKYGFIDKNGKTVLPFLYDSATDFHKGKAMVERKGNSYELDSQKMVDGQLKLNSDF